MTNGADDRPFIREERSLINEVCTKLGHTLERRRLHEVLVDREALMRSMLTTSHGIIYRYRFWHEPASVYVSPLERPGGLHPREQDAAIDIRNALQAVIEEGGSVHYESSMDVAPGNVRYFVRNTVRKRSAVPVLQWRP